MYNTEQQIEELRQLAVDFVNAAMARRPKRSPAFYLDDVDGDAARERTTSGADDRNSETGEGYGRGY
ncbi:MAG: hypothetical protein NVSMB64_26140 [Candidatus Velthaea sp.]